MEFEWDPNKAARNLKWHGVPFPEAATVFEDPLSVAAPDPDHSFEEQRQIIVGSSHRGTLLMVAYTERGERIHHIVVEPGKSAGPSGGCAAIVWVRLTRALAGRTSAQFLEGGAEDRIDERADDSAECDGNEDARGARRYSRRGRRDRQNADCDDRDQETAGELRERPLERDAA